jgi:ribulose kinase
MGAAIVAGLASGVFNSTAEAANRWIELKTAEAVKPDLWSHYEKRVESYQSLLISMNKFYTAEEMK